MTTLVADFGGTRIKIGVVRNGAVLAETAIPAGASGSVSDRLAAVAVEWRHLCQQQHLTPHACAGIGLSFPSLVDVAHARALDEHGKFRDAPQFDFRGWARATFALPLALENDARMALIGEWQYGAARGSDHVAILTLGTGLGTAAVIEGRLLRGGHGQAGILSGHWTVHLAGRACQCGNLGCAEAQASTAVLAEVARATPGFDASPLARQDPLDYAAVFAAAADGDPCALALREHSLRVWSALAVNLVHAYDPEILVLAGGIMASGDTILPAVRDYVHRHARTPWGKVNVCPSALGHHAALLAGEWLVRDLCQ